MDSVPLAISCIADVNVVVSAVPANSTFAPFTKLLPLMVSEKLPAVIVVGWMLASIGVGFQSVTALCPAALESAALTACTVTVFGLGNVAGAVKTPIVLIVPVVDTPPVTPFTCQVTAAFEVPVTAAANVSDAPARTVAELGETPTDTAGGGGGGAPGLPLPVPAVVPAQLA